jgi:hypothetical protein
MSRFVAGLIATAMRQVYPHEKAAMIKYFEQQHAAQWVLDTQRVKSSQTLNFVQCNNPQSSSAGTPEPIVYTGADNVNVIKMAGPSDSLPVLIAVINAFLHLQASPVMEENCNIDISAQF